MLPVNCFDLQMRTDEMQLPHCWTLPRVSSVSVTEPVGILKPGKWNSWQGFPTQSIPIAYKAKSPERDMEEEKRNPVWLTCSLLYLCSKSSEKVILLFFCVPCLHASMELAREVSQHTGPAGGCTVPPAAVLNILSWKGPYTGCCRTRDGPGWGGDVSRPPPMKHTCHLCENGLFWSIHIKLHSGCLEETAQLYSPKYGSSFRFGWAILFKSTAAWILQRISGNK